MLSKKLGQQLETAAIQEVDSLKRRLDHECQQNTIMKQQIVYLSTENDEVKTKNLILETTSLKQNKENDELLSELGELKQQNALLEESFRQATERGNEKEAMIKQLENDLSTAHAEVSLPRIIWHVKL